MKRLIFSIIILLFTINSFASKPEYKIIIDANDTQSILHLFQVENIKPLPLIKEIFSSTALSTLSSYADHPQDAGISLNNVLREALTYLKKINIDPYTVPISIFGTSSMRLLDENKQSAIYENVKEYIINHYTFILGCAKTLSGTMQGLYYWLDANYIAGNFIKNEPPQGIINVGNLSSEMAFATNDTRNLDDKINLKINNIPYSIYSKSFSDLGQDSARWVMNKFEQARYCYPIGYPMENQQIGQFDLKTCGSIYSKVTDPIHLPIDIHEQKFIAFSGAARIYDFLSAEIPDQMSFEARLYYVCDTPWDLMKLEYSDIIPIQTLSSYCANAVFIDQLFYNKLKLQSYQLWVTDKINQQKVDWPLGMLFYSLLTA